MSIPTYEEKLLNTSLWTDKIKLSKRIRLNGIEIVKAQQSVLQTSLVEGRAVVDIAKSIGTEGFKKELPQFLNKLKNSKIAGQKISPAQFRKARRQIEKLANDNLRVSYTNLLDTIDLGGNLDKAVTEAMIERTNSYSLRLARTEAIESVSLVKNGVVMEDEDTQYVKNITSGDDPCNYCSAVEDMGYIPVANATIPTHHPNCSCTPDYRKTSKRPKAWSTEKHDKTLQSNINKLNKSNPGSKTSQLPEKPQNLRDNTMLKRLGE